MEGKYYIIQTCCRGFVTGEGYINFPTEDEYFEYLREEKDDNRGVSNDSN